MSEATAFYDVGKNKTKNGYVGELRGGDLDIRGYESWPVTSVYLHILGVRLGLYCVLLPADYFERRQRR